MLIRLSSPIIKSIRYFYCTQYPQLTQQQNNNLETKLEQMESEFIYLAKQNNKKDDSNDGQDEDTKDLKDQNEKNKQIQESESDSDDDDDEPKGGRRIPLIELVKGFIPRLLKQPEPQE